MNRWWSQYVPMVEGERSSQEDGASTWMGRAEARAVQSYVVTLDYNWVTRYPNPRSTRFEA